MQIRPGGSAAGFASWRPDAAALPWASGLRARPSSMQRCPERRRARKTGFAASGTRCCGSERALTASVWRCGTTLAARQGLGLADFADHGGGFPLLLRDTGCVGCIAFSGLPQREDHELVVDAIASVLGIEVKRLSMEKDS